MSDDIALLRDFVDRFAEILPRLNLASENEREQCRAMLSRMKYQLDTGEPNDDVIRECKAYWERFINEYEEAERRVDELLEKRRPYLASVEARYTDVFKAQQEFQQHLMLLNAGTLSLIITAVVALVAANHVKEIPLALTQRFFLGCELLVFSIIIGIMHNVMNIRLLSSRRIDIQSSLYPFTFTSPSTPPKKGRTDRLISTNSFEWYCFWLILAAQTCTVAASCLFLMSLAMLLQRVGSKTPRAPVIADVTADG